MSMHDRDGKIWMDGQLVEWRDAKIHVLSHTLHYGCGAFEGVRAYDAVGGTAIFRHREHTERLFNSAKILRMKIPFTPEQIMAATREVVRSNGLRSCYIRPLTWIGSEKLGVSPKGNTIHVMVAAWPWGAYLGEDGLPVQQMGILEQREIGKARVMAGAKCPECSNTTLIRKDGCDFCTACVYVGVCG